MRKSTRIFWLASGAFLTLAACILIPALRAEDAANKPEFVIEEYVFSWTVTEVDDIKFSIMKTNETIEARLYDDNNHNLWMTATDGDAIAEVLGRTDEFYTKFKGKNEESEEVKIKGFIIEFWTSDKGAFYVSIDPDKELTTEGITLTRKEATTLAPVMAKSSRMCAFVDQKINP